MEAEVTDVIVLFELANDGRLREIILTDSQKELLMNIVIGFFDERRIKIGKTLARKEYKCEDKQ